MIFGGLGAKSVASGTSDSFARVRVDGCHAAPLDCRALSAVALQRRFLAALAAVAIGRLVHAFAAMMDGGGGAATLAATFGFAATPAALPDGFVVSLCPPRRLTLLSLRCLRWTLVLFVALTVALPPSGSA